jgi:hypothetical protein
MEAEQSLTPQTTAASVLGDPDTLVPLFDRSLRAADKSPKTVEAQTEAADQRRPAASARRSRSGSA